jgi:hypothetical protein
MHSTDITLPRGPITVHHNGDYSGDVLVPVYKNTRCVPGDHLEYTIFEAPETAVTVPEYIGIPFEVMKTLVADHLRSDLMSMLEDMSSDEVLDYLIGRLVK